MSYDDTAPLVDKFLHADGSVTTMAGEVILPADQNRAKTYEEMTPQVAKWLNFDGSVTAEIPVPPMGSAYTGHNTPDVSIGDIGDFYITSDGIYVKKRLSDGAGFNLTCNNLVLSGYWRDMGVNTVISSSGGNPQGSHYYRHESGHYFLCWNTAYGGYWWITTDLSFDNGNAMAYRTTPIHTEVPPNDAWRGGLSGILSWTKAESSSSELEFMPSWERCFSFCGINDVPHYKTDRLMRYSEGLVKELASGGNMARLDSNDFLFVGESLFAAYSPTAMAQSLPIGSFRNFKVDLLAAAITLSFSEALPSGNYPVTLKIWLIPKSTVTGNPKHTVTWPTNITWIGTEEACKCIGKTGKVDTPVLVELTTFDNGSNWIGRAYNAIYPEHEVLNV